MQKLWISYGQFTVQVNVDDSGRIVATPPVLRKFLGQPINNLQTWLTKNFPGWKAHVL